jgi:hypothetical protein
MTGTKESLTIWNNEKPGVSASADRLNLFAVVWCALSKDAAL